MASARYSEAGGLSMKLVSVCIPSYNASKYIKETIQSVLDSTYSKLEIIVNDDASTDNTRAIVESLGDPRVRFYQNESNLGPGKNWNRTMEKVSGEFVGLLNHDDLYGPFWLSLAVHVLKKYPHIGWTASANRVINGKGETLGAASPLPETREYSRGEAFLWVAEMNTLSSNYIARRKIMEEIGYYDEEASYAADVDLFLRLASRYPLYYSSNPHHAAWRLHADNLSHQIGLVTKIADTFRLLDKTFGNNDLPEELMQYKKPCYIYHYNKVLKTAQALLKKGDLETVQHLIDLLHTNGYPTDQS